MRKTFYSIITIVVIGVILIMTNHNNPLPVNANAGNTGDVAVKSVFRIYCKNTYSSGTGFLHKSGWIITASHVIKDCSKDNILLFLPEGKSLGIKEVRTNPKLDLALIQPVEKIETIVLPISTSNSFVIGDEVSTWGFPSGYQNPRRPLLSVGNLSGEDSVNNVTRWVVNAAFNSGNSGGPLIKTDTGEVIGVVVSKLAPIPDSIQSALQALENQRSGFQYPVTYPDGSQGNMSEGQVIYAVLNYLRSQTQLVIGHSTTLGDLRSFLTSFDIEP